MKTTVKTLFNKGYNKSQIAKILKIDRKTVSKVLSSNEEEVKKEYFPRKSMLDPYKEYIEIQMNKELSIKRIYQDLVREFGFDGSYDAVKRYVRKIKKIEPNAYMVLNSLPGEEAQVDFGFVGTIKVNGKSKKAWVFVMELSYSRYMYSQIVFDQSVKTFIECHKNAFKFFGGVPQTVKIDNLKAGILEADFYEPTVQKTYASFSVHYGFWAQPCRVRTPTDKGKVEANVNYIKDNCFKGRDFKDIEDARAFLSDWLDNIANVRIHGTTKKIPSEIFKSIEKKELKSLPKEDFIFSKSSKAVVNTNCHISYEGNYYSVPYIYIGQEVDAIEVNNIVKIYSKEKEIALHLLCSEDKGKYITNKEHYPHSKNITSADILSRQREEMSQIGEGALLFFENFIQKQNVNKYDYKSIYGILSLRKKYDDKTIDQACRRAVYYNALSYKAVKKICEKNIFNLPTEMNESYINTEETKISRKLSEYSKFLN